MPCKNLGEPCIGLYGSNGRMNFCLTRHQTVIVRLPSDKRCLPNQWSLYPRCSLQSQHNNLDGKLLLLQEIMSSSLRLRWTHASFSCMKLAMMMLFPWKLWHHDWNDSPIERPANRFRTQIGSSIQLKEIVCASLYTSWFVCAFNADLIPNKQFLTPPNSSIAEHNTTTMLPRAYQRNDESEDDMNMRLDQLGHIYQTLQCIGLRAIAQRATMRKK